MVSSFGYINDSNQLLYILKEKIMNIREKLGLPPKAIPQFGQSRSHAMNSSKKTFKPNIQNKTVVLDGKRYKVKLTTIPYTRSD